jgi:hypothetical protein
VAAGEYLLLNVFAVSFWARPPLTVGKVNDPPLVAIATFVT